MKRAAVLVVALGLVSSCGNAGQAPVQAATVEEWCSEQSPDRCVEGMVFLHAFPDRDQCLLGLDAESDIWQTCGQPDSTSTPITTVPDPGQVAAEAEERRRFVEQELPLLDARIIELLTGSQPIGMLTVGVVLTKPMTLPAIEDLAEGLGGQWVSAWRTDYVCTPDFSGQPHPDRFALRDGFERAEAARRSADQSEVPVTGRFLLEATWNRWQVETEEIMKPGVLVEAIEVSIPVEALPQLRTHAGVETVRLAASPAEADDLSEPAPLECPPGD